MKRDTFVFTSPAELDRRSPADFIETFRAFYGPTMNAYEAAEKAGRVDELHAQLIELAHTQNRATDGGTHIPATFMRITIQL